MADSIAGVVLGAGAGERLRPLTAVRPKVLCPVGDRPMIDHALARFEGVTDSVAVNVHHGRALMEAHLGGRVHLSFEREVALGTAGALGLLRSWIDTRPVVVVNGDTYCPSSIGVLLDGWDATTIRVLVPTGQTFGPNVVIAGALMPWADVSPLLAEPSGLYEMSWRDAGADGRIEVVYLAADAPCIDCATPAAYLDANLAWSGGESVVGAGAEVRGTLEQSVVWPGAVVHHDEHLVRAIRAHQRLTVMVR
jgi:GTP:adenosylcobinamide-phosphate guanylyltransferase